MDSKDSGQSDKKRKMKKKTAKAISGMGSTIGDEDDLTSLATTVTSSDVSEVTDSGYTDVTDMTSGATMVPEVPKIPIVQHPADVLITEMGKKAVFTCKIGQEAKLVRWRKNGNDVRILYEKTSVVTEGLTTTLTIENVDRFDVADYTCCFDEHSESQAGKLIFKVPCKLEFEGDRSIKIAGKHFDFKINVIGFPLPQLTMTHNDESLRVRGEVQNYDDFVSVRIRDLKRSDTGKLKFFAENEHSKNELEVDMEVIDVPSEPLHVDSDDITPTSVVISWKTPREDHGSPITGYVVERKSRKLFLQI